MDVIVCDARVAVAGAWVQCEKQTTSTSTAGWTVTRDGDFCPRHAPMHAAGRAA